MIPPAETDPKRPGRVEQPGRDDSPDVTLELRPGDLSLISAIP
jgi:hypothetical protein